MNGGKSRTRRHAALGAASLLLAACGTVLGYGDISYSEGSDGGVAEGAVDEAAGGDDGGAGEAAADANCVDLRSDPHNCGRCGRSCLGGSCNDGGCAPFELVRDAAAPRGLVMNDDDLYYVVNVPDAGDHIERVPKTGGAPTRVSDDDPQIMQIALEAPYFYFSGKDSLKRRRVDLTAPAEYVFPVDTRFWTGAFALWDLEVWAVRPESGYRLVRTPKEPGPSNTAAVFGPMLEYPGTVTLTRAGLFVGDVFYVRRVSPPNWSEVANRAPIAAAADDQYLWFSQKDDLRIKRISLDAPPFGTTDAGDPVEDLPAGAGPAGEMFVDETHVYWLTIEASGYLHRIAKPDGGIETVVNDVRRGAGIAGDATRVCFGEQDLGRIRCIAK